MPDELVGAPANRCCALLRQHDEPPYTLQPQNRAARDEGVAHTLPTHYERDATAGTREADGTLQICMRPRAFKLRRARIAARATARLQHDGDGATSRRRYGGGRVYVELTIDGWTSRPAGGLVWPDGVKASSMEGPVRRHEADRSN